MNTDENKKPADEQIENPTPKAEEQEQKPAAQPPCPPKAEEHAQGPAAQPPCPPKAKKSNAGKVAAAAAGGVAAVGLGVAGTLGAQAMMNDEEPINDESAEAELQNAIDNTEANDAPVEEIHEGDAVHIEINVDEIEIDGLLDDIVEPIEEVVALDPVGVGDEIFSHLQDEALANSLSIDEDVLALDDVEPTDLGIEPLDPMDDIAMI